MKRVALGVLMVMLSSGKTDDFSIQLSRTVVMAGDEIRLTCHVPKRAENRTLEFGIVGTREASQRQLDGLDSSITWSFWIDHIVCGSGPAYCSVKTSDERWTTVRHNLEVTGCDGS